MATDLSSLVLLSKNQIKPAAEMLGRAFYSYPLLEYYYPDELVREKIALYFVSVSVYSGIRYGEVYATSSNLEGVAVWVSSDDYPVNIWRVLRSVPLSIIFSFGRYGGRKMKKLGAYLDSVHKRLAPFKHSYLQVIGVDPRFQGKGYAGKLLKPMLARIDEEGLPCYLETVDENNVPLYEHFRFTIVEKSAIPGTDLISWAMLREKAN